MEKINNVNLLTLQAVVIYQQYLYHKEIYETKVEPMVVDDKIGKNNNVTEFLMKTHERVNGGERYFFYNQDDYIKCLLFFHNAVVYIIDSSTDSLVKGTLYLSDNANDRNIEELTKELLSSVDSCQKNGLAFHLNIINCKLNDGVIDFSDNTVIRKDNIPSLTKSLTRNKNDRKS